MKQPVRIFVVCKKAKNREMMLSALEGHYESETAATPEAAWQLAGDTAPAVLICEATGQPSDSTSVYAMVIGDPDSKTGLPEPALCDYLPEPFTSTQLLSFINPRIKLAQALQHALNAEAELDTSRWMLDGLDDGVFRLDRDWCFTYLNSSAERLMGSRREDLLGRSLWQSYSATVGTIVEREFLRAIQSRSRIEFENYYEPWQRWFNLKAHPSDGGNLTVFFSDITEKKQLRPAQARLAAIVESSNDAIISKDLNGVVQSWNRAAERIFGYTAEEIIGRPVAVLAAPGVESEMPDILGRIRRGETVNHYRTRRKTKDGRILTVSLTVSPVRDDDGTIIGASKIARDITEQERAETLLVESRQRLQAIYDGTYDYLGLLAPDGTVLEANRASLDFGGNQREEVVGRFYYDGPWFSRTPGAPDHVRRALERAAAGEFQRFEAALVRPSGVVSTFDISLHPVFDDHGKVILIVPEGREITERKRAQEALRISQDRLRQAFDSMPQLVWSADPSGRRDLFNKQWYEYTGLTAEESAGPQFDSVIHPDERSVVRERWQNSLAKGAVFEAEFRCRRHDGQYRWFLGRATPIPDEHGTPVRWLATNTDIDAWKRAEHSLLRANEDLGQFAHAASHDLQEPLRSFSVYTELLDTHYRERLDENGAKFLDFLKIGVRRMEELIRGLLTYTQVIGAGQTLRAGMSDANAALRAAEADLREPIKNTGALIICETLPVLPVREIHLTEIFRNLIENAIRTANGSSPEIRISVEAAGQYWLFAVRDNGTGIDGRYKERTFGLFKRLQTTDVYPGGGIGLPVSRRIIESYGGGIDVDSEPGQGSTFRFTLPR